MIKKILVPIHQGSKNHSQKTAEMLKTFLPEEIVFLHVLKPIPTLIGGKEREKIRKLEVQCRQKLVPEMDSFLQNEKVMFKIVIEHGELDTSIIQVAEREQVDLIIMPTSGQDAFSNVFLGSQTERVLRNSQTMLLVVPH